MKGLQSVEDDLYGLVYCSRNTIDGADLTPSIAAILASARRNNVRVGVTGALLYSDGGFAQVLEGPLQAVEDTFNRIQCDERHSDVTILRFGRNDRRQFPAWSMAHVSEGSASILQSVDRPGTSDTERASEIIALLLDVLHRDKEWAPAA